MMESSVTSGMCRCCGSEGLFKDVNATYHWMGEDEIYADMLQFSLDITLSTAEDENNGGICEVCITQLRNAANFKKQVLETEEKFKQIQEQKAFKPELVKVEMSLEDEGDSDNNLSEDYQSGADFDLPIKEESPEPKTRKRAAKATTSRAKKSKTDLGEPSTKRKTSTTEESDDDKMTLEPTNFAVFIEIPSQTRPVRLRSTHPEPKSQLRPIPQPKPSSKPNLQGSPRKATELDFQFDNIRSILQCSNATPIRCGVEGKYNCGYCPKSFLSPEKLKKHTLETHQTHKPECLKTPALSRYVVFLDVTELTCRLCDDPIQNLSELMDHLKVQHSQPIHTDVKSHLVLLDFPDNCMRCPQCEKRFDGFEALIQHASSHNKNYPCDLCVDRWFVNKSLMIEHKKTVHFL